MQKFINDYFLKERSFSKSYAQVKPKVTVSRANQNNKAQSIKTNNSSRKQNPYDFNFNDVSEEDIIKGAVESNISVFLHGKSSDGKSARVKQLDPDCEIIYMRNATPDSLNGKSVYNAEKGEMIDIPPTWYTNI